MPLRRVMRSEDLPAPPAPPDAGGGEAFIRIRQQAIAATVAQPEVREAVLGRVPVILARLKPDLLVAFSAFCPHQGTPLRHASFYEGHLRCPQHNYVYDVETGANIVPSRDARPEVLWKLKPGYLRLHRVEEREGWIWVDEEPLPPPAGYDPDLEAAPAGTKPRPPTPLPPPRFTAPPQAVTDPVEHPAEDVTVSAGEEFELVLPTNPVPGHLWKIEPSGDVVSVLRQVFDPDSAQPRCRVRLRATAEGEVTLRCAYAKPWGTTARETRTYTIRIAPPSTRRT